MSEDTTEQFSNQTIRLMKQVSKDHDMILSHEIQLIALSKLPDAIGRLSSEISTFRTQLAVNEVRSSTRVSVYDRVVNLAWNTLICLITWYIAIHYSK